MAFLGAGLRAASAAIGRQIGKPPSRRRRGRNMGPAAPIGRTPRPRGGRPTVRTTSGGRRSTSRASGIGGSTRGVGIRRTGRSTGLNIGSSSGRGRSRATGARASGVGGYGGRRPGGSSVGSRGRRGATGARSSGVGARGRRGGMGSRGRRGATGARGRRGGRR